MKTISWAVHGCLTGAADHGLTASDTARKSRDHSGSQIKGDIALQDNESTITIAANTTGGSIAAEKNRGPVDISANVIGNQLTCQDNKPAPTGTGNSARQYGGQCPAPAFGTARP